MTIVSLSTIVYCAKCKQPSSVYESMHKEDDAEVFYHGGCVSDTNTETQVHSLFVTDDLNVKSEGQ